MNSLYYQHTYEPTLFGQDLRTYVPTLFGYKFGYNMHNLYTYLIQIISKLHRLFMDTTYRNTYLEYDVRTCLPYLDNQYTVDTD